jgi:hypothetical protein
VGSRNSHPVSCIPHPTPRIPYLASRNSMKILLAIAAASEAALGFALLVYPPIASRRSARVDRSGDEWQRYPVGGLVSAFGWIVGCQRQALLAVDHRARRAGDRGCERRGAGYLVSRISYPVSPFFRLVPHASVPAPPDPRSSLFSDFYPTPVVLDQSPIDRLLAL